MLCMTPMTLRAVKNTLLTVASVMNNLIFLNSIVCYFFMCYIVHNWFCADK